MAWPEPELDTGPDDGLLRPLPELLELELPEPELVELPEPELAELPEPELAELVELPELAAGELVCPLDELPDAGDLAFADEALLAPGSASTTAPAASTLATPTVAVVALIRSLPRRRAATARATLCCFGLFMT